MKNKRRKIIIEVPKPSAKQLNNILRACKGGKMNGKRRRLEKQLRKLDAAE